MRLQPRLPRVSNAEMRKNEYPIWLIFTVHFHLFQKAFLVVRRQFSLNTDLHVSEMY